MFISKFSHVIEQLNLQTTLDALSQWFQQSGMYASILAVLVVVAIGGCVLRSNAVERREQNQDSDWIEV